MNFFRQYKKFFNCRKYTKRGKTVPPPQKKKVITEVYILEK